MGTTIYGFFVYVTHGGWILLRVQDCEDCILEGAYNREQETEIVDGKVVG